MSAATKPIQPTDGMTITHDTVFAPGVYVLPDGLKIAGDGITLDGGGATLVGVERRGAGITIDGHTGVTVRNVRLRDYYHGIVARRAHQLTLAANQITSTGDIPANTIFLDIWLPAAEAYGGAILLEDVDGAAVHDNDVQHQLAGLLTYGCKRLDVRRNNASYSSGYGIHLFETCESVFEENYADYCCRYEPRDKPAPRVGAHTAGHMGADATGFLIVHNSSKNVFRRNFARLGGDGFFLAGRSAKGEAVPCNDNLFEENDGSLSPNIAFEGTFSARNVYRNNWADRCNFGFWLGFSTDCTIEGSRMVHNRQAGIAVENGARFEVRGNDFQRNHIAGILMWSQYAETWFAELPDQRTAHHWRITGNKFFGNGAGIAIRADQEHGIRPLPPAICGKRELRPHDHEIRGNDLQDNRVGIHLLATDRVTIEENTFNRNVEADIRREDDQDSQVGPNLGLRGAYL
ncbi:MAG: right-handed parallel beta-helix repeat-containing protein [Phycisphaerae bacterium]